MTDWLPLSTEQSVEGIYVTRRAGAVAKSTEAHEAVTLDFDEEGNLVGVEVLASPLVQRKEVTGAEDSHAVRA